jgi:DNA-binding transcriptional ArsR family regulator
MPNSLPIMKDSIFEIQAEFCKVMGNTTRLHVLHILRERPKTVSEICQEIGLSQSNVSRQLACLRNAGVVITKRDRAGMVYQITDEKIVEVCDLVRSVLVEQIQKRSRSIGH